MEAADNRIRIGGLKILEEGACVASSSPGGDHRLAAGVCAPLAQHRINLTYLTHVAGDHALDSLTLFCTDGAAGEASLSLVRAHQGGGTWQLHPGTFILSLYPHDKRPEISGHFIRSLAQARVYVIGLASSPAAISGVFSGGSRNRALKQLFRDFRFPAFGSPREFYAAQVPPEEYVQKVVASYQEKVIKVYYILQQSDLDLWDVSLPSPEALSGLGTALAALGEQGWKLPFLVALPGLPKGELLCSFGLAGDGPSREAAAQVREILAANLPGIAVRRQTPVAGIFFHGPHFGDRYGIAHALLEALRRARVAPLGLSCTVSSISVVLRQQDLAPALVVLGNTFEAPVEAR